MEIEIDSKKNNPLLKRTEVYFKVKHTGEGTPNREIIRSEIADKLNSKKENVIINIMKPGFGIQETTGYAKVYLSLESSKGLEREHILKRNKLGETKKDAKTSEVPVGETSAPQTSPAQPQVKTKESAEPKAEEKIKQSEPPKTAPIVKETKQKESKAQEKTQGKKKE
jgi:small subunit ribosomal protein S24e